MVPVHCVRGTIIIQSSWMILYLVFTISMPTNSLSCLRQQPLLCGVSTSMWHVCLVLMLVVSYFWCPPTLSLSKFMVSDLYFILFILFFVIFISFLSFSYLLLLEDLAKFGDTSSGQGWLTYSDLIMIFTIAFFYKVFDLFYLVFIVFIFVSFFCVTVSFI